MSLPWCILSSVIRFVKKLTHLEEFSCRVWQAWVGGSFDGQGLIIRPIHPLTFPRLFFSPNTHANNCFQQRPWRSWGLLTPTPTSLGSEGVARPVQPWQPCGLEAQDPAWKSRASLSFLPGSKMSSTRHIQENRWRKSSHALIHSFTHSPTECLLSTMMCQTLNHVLSPQ